MKHVYVLTRHNDRMNQNARPSALVEDGVFPGESARVDTNLVAVHTSPSEKLALLIESNGAAATARNARHVEVVKRLNLGRLKDSSTVLASIGLNTDPTKAVRVLVVCRPYKHSHNE